MFNHIDLLSVARGAEQDMLLKLMQEHQFGADVDVHPVTETQARCFLIVSGFVRVHNKHLGQWLLKPGAAFGLVETYLGPIPGQSYRTACPCTLLALDREPMSALLASDTKLARALQVELARVAGQASQRRLARIARLI